MVLSVGADIDATNIQGQTPLMFAAYAGKTDAIILLIGPLPLAYLSLHASPSLPPSSPPLASKK